MLIELVMRLQGRMDIEMLQQHAAGACVFRQNQINRFQRLNRTESHVLQIADRCGNDIQHLSETADSINDEITEEQQAYINGLFGDNKQDEQDEQDSDEQIGINDILQEQEASDEEQNVEESAQDISDETVESE